MFLLILKKSDPEIQWGVLSIAPIHYSKRDQGAGQLPVLSGIGVSEPTVKKWRSRWEASYEVLCKVEAEGLNGSDRAGKDDEIIRQIQAILADQPRSGTPPRITLSQKEQIVALATEKPEDHNIPMTVWSYEMLAHVAKAQGIVESISGRHVGTLLKKRN